MRGTIAELAGKLSVNGIVLNQPELSMLTRIGRNTFCREVGNVKTGGRGKPSKIWEFDTTFALSLDTAIVVAVAVAVEPTVEVSGTVTDDAVKAVEDAVEPVAGTADDIHDFDISLAA